MRLRDRRVLVTGAASGIGLAVAHVSPARARGSQCSIVMRRG
jgi:NAD(P)-dependent dehydrogenase (short-subunit alcohol dehydrogenase family)